MRNDEDYFTRDKAFLIQVRKQIAGIQTVADLRQRALFCGWRGAGQLIAEKIDQLTQRKVKPDGTRDGRWIWKNIQALMGRRISESHPIDSRIAGALQSLIVRDYGSFEFWELTRNWRNRLAFQKKYNPNDPARSAIDVLTVLIEQTSKGETLSD
jgi:hypothetical protein